MEMVSISTIVMKRLKVLEFTVRKRKGSEIEGAIELRMSLYHRKTHFLKYVSTVNESKEQMSMLKTLSLRSQDAF